MLDIDLPFSNPFSQTTMMTYNPRQQSLVTWDAGNQLTYPVKYHSITYAEEPDAAPANVTGYELHPGGGGGVGGGQAAEGGGGGAGAASLGVPASKENN